MMEILPVLPAVHPRNLRSVLDPVKCFNAAFPDERIFFKRRTTENYYHAIASKWDDIKDMDNNKDYLILA